MPHRDVLESIFGSYKHFSSRCPIKELRSMLLTIPLTTVDLTPDFIRQALFSVTSHHLSQWIQQTFGLSLLSKRKFIFQHSC